MNTPASRSSASIATIHAKLIARENQLWIGVAILLAIGIPMVFVGPLLMATIFWLATAGLVGYYPWKWFAIAFIVLFTPLLFWTERRTRGAYFVDAVASSGDAPALPFAAFGDIGLLVALTVNPRVSVSGFVEIFLTGPRYVLDAWDKFRGAKALAITDRERAATIIAELQRLDRGLSISQLVKAPENKNSISIPIAYLVFHDWIGISKAADKIWILTDARNRLS